MGTDSIAQNLRGQRTTGLTSVGHCSLRKSACSFPGAVDTFIPLSLKYKEVRVHADLTSRLGHLEAVMEVDYAEFLMWLALN